MPEFGPGVFDLSSLRKREPAEGAGTGSGAGAFEAFITATDDNIEAEVIRLSVQIPVIVVVGSARSPESEELRSTLKSLAEGQREFRVAYVDADATPMLAQMLGVRAVPTAIALAAGRPVASFQGNQPREELSQWVQALVSNVGPQLEGLPAASGEESPAEAEDPRLAQATEALNRSDFDAAIAVYDAILADDPRNKEISQARATVGVLKRLDPANRTTDAVEDAAADPGDVDKQLAAADAEVVAGAPERAFDRLVALAGAEPRAKERLLELFTLFDAGDPRVIAARTKLASALF
ncbi:tetratricopeptide repeat protein [Corynebacterium sp. UBA2622]|uniref:tetratricopeptide repeat protein n=1 Tax=Corynebacterium sp. UBA2622 TaxID=1946393 RepID=UPI0025C41EA6|nr:tetratricopeptide repeat protein [Corynebacterium sp. UBA2622]